LRRRQKKNFLELDLSRSGRTAGPHLAATATNARTASSGVTRLPHRRKGDTEGAARPHAILITMEVTLRPARPDERPWLFDLHEAAMRPMVEEVFGAWDRTDQLRRFEERAEDLVEVIEADGRAVGAIHLATDDDGSVVIGLVEVLPACQGLGIGGQAIRVTCERAAREGRHVSLRVRKPNRARRLYERLGFAVEGENETHYLMRKT